MIDARRLRLIAGWPHANRGRRRAYPLSWRPKPCLCHTLHGHCYASPCPCPNHRDEIGAP